MSPDDKLLTVEQAAERIQMHPATIRRFIRDGAITGRRIGARQWRISETDLKRFIESGGSAPQSVSPPSSPAEASSRDGHRKQRPTTAAPKRKTAAKKPPAKRK